jgi:hypothetical protein
MELKRSSVVAFGHPIPFHILHFYEWGCSGIPIDNNLMTTLSSKQLGPFKKVQKDQHSL